MRAWENDPCPTGKIPYHSRHAANHARTRLQQRRGFKTRGQLNTFRCDHCPHYHLGNSTPSRRPTRQAA